MACMNEEINLMAQHEIKVEEIEIDIKVQEDIWPSWVEDLPQMKQPHKDVNEPLVHLKPHSVFCTCLTTLSMMTRSQSRRHKENCYKIYN